MCYSKDEKKKTSIEIHQADCMCEATNKQHVTSSTYTPLDVLNEVENNNQSNDHITYIVRSRPLLNMLNFVIILIQVLQRCKCSRICTYRYTCTVLFEEKDWLKNTTC